MSAPVPVTVIAGPLGSGKTTLVNHILRRTVGHRIAVLVNDFGDLDIDAAMIESAGAETISLRNGCICCSLGDSLSEGLAALLRSGQPPDQILVEASGVSLPRGLVGAVGGPGLRLDGIVVIVDAVDVTVRARDRYVGETVREQIASADMLVLNKVEEATAEQRRAARALVGALAPAVPMLQTAGGAVPLDVLLGPLQPHGRNRVAPQGPDGHTDLDTASFDSDDPVDAEALQRWLDELPDGVLRAKGMVRLAGDPAAVRVVQVVGTRRRLTRADPAAAPAGARLVVIGVPGSLHDELFAPLAAR